MLVYQRVYNIGWGLGLIEECCFLGGGSFQIFLEIFHPEPWRFFLLQCDEHMFQMGWDMLNSPTSIGSRKNMCFFG